MCVQECGTGFYPSSFAYCEACDDKCQTCIAHKDDTCTTCKTPNLYVPHLTQCVANTCPAGTYKIGAECLECHGVCATCTGGSNEECLTCPPELLSVSDRSTCWTECHAGYFEENSVCRPCSDDCATCNGAANNNCLTCKSTLYLHNQARTCVTQCPAGTYLESGICFGRGEGVTHAACHADCSTCSGGSNNNCLTCKNSLIFVPTLNECWASCPDHYHQDSVDNFCYPCDAGCLACNELSDNDCVSCPGEEFLVSFLGTCTAACAPGYYESGNTCTSKPAALS